MKLYRGDCLKILPKLKSQSIDLCLTDPPYGTTACKWDTVIPFEPMWAELYRVCKNNAVICLFGVEPFSSKLRLSNKKMFRHDWIWHKNRAQGGLSAKYGPMRNHEIVSVFGGTSKFYPIKQQRHGNPHSSGKSIGVVERVNSSIYTSKKIRYSDTTKDTLANPTSIQFFKCVPNQGRNKAKHPTQKPVALLEYLIKTYTKEGDTVLDFAMGSGSTGVACANLGRKFIGIEKDEKYFRIAKERLKLPC